MKAGENTKSFTAGRLARELPKLLDSRRPDGGIMRLRTDPGGRVVEPGTVTRNAEGEAEYIPGQPAAHIPLLIQHAAESEEDFRFRAAIAAPRGTAWHSVQSLAGRPFRHGLTYVTDAPAELKEGGPWASNIDGKGTKIGMFAALKAVDTIGYGQGYVWVDYRPIAGRPIWRWLDADSVPVFIEDAGVAVEVHVRWHVTGWEGVPDGEVALRFFRAGDDHQTAYYTVHPKVNGVWQEKPAKVVDLAPLTEIPIVDWHIGDEVGGAVLPPLLPAFKLEYLMIQLSSNMEYSSILANTQLRFAKGLNKEDIKNWQRVGPQYSYLTQSKEADMKYVTLAVEGIEAGLSMETALLRAIEVAGMAPLLSRLPGDEKATGQAMAGSRARSAAERFSMQLASRISRTMQITQLYAQSPGKPVIIRLTHDFGIEESDFQALALLGEMYMRGGLPHAVWLKELQRRGVLSEDHDLEAIAEYAENELVRVERIKLEIEKAKAIQGLVSNGLLLGSKEGREAIFAAYKELGIFQEDFDPATAAEWEEQAGLIRHELLISHGHNPEVPEL